ncbi:MAG: ATP-grasp domain-containing protein, partial [Candidatus Brocadiia bacterium]
MMRDVLILHNSVDIDLPGQKTAWAESNAGVLDQVNAVSGALEKLGVGHEVDSIGDIRELADVLMRKGQHVIFNLVEEFPGNIEDACYVPSVCYAHGRVCTGNGTAGLLMAQNKWKTKAVLGAVGVPCPQGVVVPIGRKFCQNELPPGKYIVKPVYSDASEGIDVSSIVELPGSGMAKAVDRVHIQFGQPAIVEQFISPRELNVSVLERNGKAEVLPVAEIDFGAFETDRPRIVDYDAKWRADSFAFHNTPRIIPAPISSSALLAVQRYAVEAWDVVGCKGYARVDFRMDDH